MSKIKNLFNNFEWLKDSSGTWSFARVIGAICVLFIQPTIMAYIYHSDTISNVNNIWQFLVICIPSITTISLFLIDIFRDKNNLKLKLGDKEYGISSEK